MLTIESFTGTVAPAGAVDESLLQVARLRELLEMNRRIVSSLDPAQVLPMVVEKAAELTGADACVLLLADAGRATVAAWLDLAEEKTATFSATLDENIDLALRQLFASGPEDGVVAVPVVAAGAINGVLAAHWRTPRRPQRDDEFLLSAMADQTAIALAHALSYQGLYRSEREARETAEHAVRTRDEFLAMVSHDLRNPLGTISMSASLLLHQLSAALDARVRSQVERIQRSVDQMIRLVDDLLDMAKLESGTFSIELLPQDALALAREVMDPSVPAARQKGLELTLELPIDIPIPALPVVCDRQRVLQVLGNLLGNALKFTPAKGAVVLRVERRGDEVVFSVTDTGPGIPEDQLPHVFERFWRADRQNRRASGLGLFIARSLVHAHGGRIWAESKVGVGSVFAFALPAGPDA